MKKCMSLIICVFISVLLIGCDSIQESLVDAQTYQDTPVDVVRKLFDSMAENDPEKYLDAITPEDRRQPGYFYYRNLMQGLFGYLSLGDMDAADISVSFNDMSYEETYNNGDIAIVRVSGLIRDLSLAVEDNFDADVVVVKTESGWLVSINENASHMFPTATPIISTVANSSGWKVFLTNLTESPSDRRGWKSIEVQMVFESTSSNPFPLYHHSRRLRILDSTGNWREDPVQGLIICGDSDYEPGDLYNGSPGTARNPIRVPEGVRFTCRTSPIEIPENSFPQQFMIRICGSWDCDPSYAVFEVSIDELFDTDSITYPYDTQPPITHIEDEIIITSSSSLTITLLPDVVLEIDEQYHFLQPLWNIRVENKAGNDLKIQDIPTDWIITLITTEGMIFNASTSCHYPDFSVSTIPPAYSDILHCWAMLTDHNTDVSFDNPWIGFATEDGTYFAQMVMDVSMVDGIVR